GAGYVSVLRGSGTGAFRSASIIFGGRSDLLFQDFFAVDFDGDGNRDVLDAGVGFRVVTWLGRSDGTFRPTEATLLSQGQWAIAAGDFDGDEFPDLLLADLRVLTGLGDGKFLLGPKASLDLGERAYLGKWTTADLDADGRPDLARVDGGNLHAYLNRGAFLFAAPEDPYPLGSGAEDVLAADLDGDGIPDLAASGADHDEVWVAPGLGEGIFLRPVRRFPLSPLGDAG